MRTGHGRVARCSGFLPMWSRELTSTNIDSLASAFFVNLLRSERGYFELQICGGNSFHANGGSVLA